MFFRYLEINFCLIFSVKLENGHEIGPKSIVSINGKIKKSLCHTWSLFFDARAGWILLINALQLIKSPGMFREENDPPHFGVGEKMTLFEEFLPLFIKLDL